MYCRALVEPQVMRQRTTDPGMPWGQIVSVSLKAEEGRIPSSVGPGSPKETYVEVCTSLNSITWNPQFTA